MEVSSFVAYGTYSYRLCDEYSKTVGDVAKTQFAFTTSCAKGGVNDGVQPYNDYRNEGCDLFNMVGVD